MVKKRSGECEGPFAQTTGPAELWPWPQHSNGYHTGARHCGMERGRVLGREGSVIHHNSEIKSRMTMEGRSIVSFRRQGTFKPDRQTFALLWVWALCQRSETWLQGQF